MTGPVTNLVAALAATVALTGSACTAGGDQMLLDRFFAASRLRDRTALGRFSTVVYEPLADGMVVRFGVVGTTPERRRDAVNGGDRGIAALSLNDPAHPVDRADGRLALIERDVTVSADVRLPDGSAATKNITVTLQRAQVDGPARRTGRWIVTRFR